jgi:hypothetical protein
MTTKTWVGLDVHARSIEAAALQWQLSQDRSRRSPSKPRSPPSPRWLATHPAARFAPHLCTCGLFFERQPENRLRAPGTLNGGLRPDVYSHVLPQADEEAALRIAALVLPLSRPLPGQPASGK